MVVYILKYLANASPDAADLRNIATNFSLPLREGLREGDKKGSNKG